jgi:hypothetical protein
LPDRSRAANALTIMMTDVVGSTELRRACGDEDADDILTLQAAIVQHQVAAFGGRVRKSLGDGFLISFPSEVAAVRAAVAIQRALEEHNTAEPQRAPGFSGCGDSLSCGACTRCPGTTPQRAHGPVLCEHRSPLSWNETPRERVYASW